jgi:hypothetical protein
MMWIETHGSESTPPVDALARLTLDVGPAPINGSAFAVERIRRTHPHSYLRNGSVSNPIHILENSFFVVHIWGSPSLQN